MKKGFVLVETMIVSLFILVSVMMLYKSFSSIIGRANNRKNNDTITDVYKLRTLMEYIPTNVFNSGLNEISANGDLSNAKKELFNSSAKIYTLKENFNLSNIISSNSDLKNSFINYLSSLSGNKNYYIVEYAKNDKYYYISLEPIKDKTKEETPQVTYTVTFNANGGSTPTNSKTVSPESTYGTLPTASRTYYNFLGWFTQSSGGTQITESSTVSITSNQTLYAHWSLSAPGYTSCTESSSKLNCKIIFASLNYKTVTNDTMFQNISDLSQMGLWLENRTGKTENNQPVYFFRGATQNNYVSFAGKIWRIVRLNEDGTIKLILGGASTTDGYGGTTTKYNQNINAATYVDYSLSTNELKTANETWYSNNIGNNSTYYSKVASTKFCNDKSVVASFGNGTKYFGGFSRLSGYSIDGNYTSEARSRLPQFKCPNASDNLIYSVGALTADEVVYAGVKNDTYNTTYYLYDNAQSSGATGWWWLLTPRDLYDGTLAYLFVVGGSGNFTACVGNCTLPFRPVISLKADTVILSGNGTKTLPYII